MKKLDANESMVYTSRKTNKDIVVGFSSLKPIKIIKFDKINYGVEIFGLKTEKFKRYEELNFISFTYSDDPYMDEALDSCNLGNFKILFAFNVTGKAFDSPHLAFVGKLALGAFARFVFPERATRKNSTQRFDFSEQFKIDDIIGFFIRPGKNYFERMYNVVLLRSDSDFIIIKRYIDPKSIYHPVLFKIINKFDDYKKAKEVFNDACKIIS